MAQLDFVMYFNFVYFFNCCCFMLTTLWFMLFIPDVYLKLRTRSLLLQELGLFVFEGAAIERLLKNLIFLKLFKSRSRDFLKYLCKNVK